MEWIKHILTECDNETFSSPRVAAFFLMLTFIGLSIADFVANRKFDGQAFGLGGAATIAAMGGAIKMGERRAQEDKP